MVMCAVNNPFCLYATEALKDKTIEEQNFPRVIYAIRYDETTDSTFFLTVDPDQSFVWYPIDQVKASHISNSTGKTGKKIKPVEK